MVSVGLQNRWSLLTDLGDEEDNEIEIVESVYAEQSEDQSKAIVEEKQEEEEEEAAETWRLHKSRSSRRKRKICFIHKLPRDVMSLMFAKLGWIEILSSAQKVCSLWRDISKEPRFFGSIDLRKQWKRSDRALGKLVKIAVRRSGGQLTEFSIRDYHGEYNLLRYVAYHSKTSLQCLRLVKCHIHEKDLIDVVRNVPCLEELDLSYFYFRIPNEVIAEIGRTCTNLKCFRLDTELSGAHHAFGEVAFPIADNMPQLRRLHLYGNPLTNEGLQAIVDGCPYLEYLDLRCEYYAFSGHSGEQQMKCLEKIRDVRLPEDSADDYDYADIRNSRRDAFCLCGCGSYHYEEENKYDEHVEEDDDEDYEKLFFLPPKAVACYL